MISIAVVQARIVNVRAQPASGIKAMKIRSAAIAASLDRVFTARFHPQSGPTDGCDAP
jgi:hypothetical protein